jgi:pre-mRNA-splicing factor CDC5/CEF1
MAEALNLRNMTAAQTPLLGDENTPLHRPSGEGTGFDSATPRHQVTATPNPLATPMRAGQDFGATPRTTNGSTYGQTSLRTPMRDNLSINEDGETNYGDTPREVRLREQQAKRMLLAGFASLPKPENNFEFDADDLGLEEVEEEQPILSEEDAAERDARLEKLRIEEEQRVLARRSEVVKQNLPRPVAVNLQRLIDQLSEASQSQPAETQEACQLIDYELAQLMLHDAIAHPLPGSSVPAGTVSQYEIPEDAELTAARDEIHKELAQGLGFPGATDSQLRQTINTMAIEDQGFMTSGWSVEREQLIFDHDSNVWLDKREISEPQQNSSYAAIIDDLHERMRAEAGKAAKSEKKLGKQLGGYQMLNGKLNDRIIAATTALREQKRDYDTFSALRAAEEAAGPRRVDEKREEVAKLEKREQDLQSRYADLAQQRKEIMANIERVGPRQNRAPILMTSLTLFLFFDFSSRKTRPLQMRKTPWTLSKRPSRLVWTMLPRTMRRWRTCRREAIVAITYGGVIL